MNVVPMQRKDRLLTLAEVEAQTGLKKSTIYLLMKRSEFPRQIKVTAKKAAWVESEVLHWIGTRVDQSRANEQISAEAAAKRTEARELATLARLQAKYAHKVG